MIPNLHLSIKEIIEQGLPEQKILWEQVRLMTGEQANVQRFVYSGALSVSELITYNANKLYIGYKIQAGAPGGAVVGAPYLSLYSPANALVYNAGNVAMAWDTTAAALKFLPNDIELNNVYFSRLSYSGYVYVNFIGFKLSM